MLGTESDQSPGHLGWGVGTLAQLFFRHHGLQYSPPHIHFLQLLFIESLSKPSGGESRKHQSPAARDQLSTVSTKESSRVTLRAWEPGLMEQGLKERPDAKEEFSMEKHGAKSPLTLPTNASRARPEPTCLSVASPPSQGQTSLFGCTLPTQAAVLSFSDPRKDQKEAG